MTEQTSTSPGEKATPGESRFSLLRALPVLVFAAMAIAFAFALFSGDPSKLPSTLIGKPVPQTTFPAVEGLLANGQPVKGFSSADLADGQAKVVNFWASWCGPCVEEHPLFEGIAKTAGVPIYGINYKDSPANARQFIGRYGNPFAFVGADSSGRNAIEWGVYGIPETYVVDGHGQIVYKHVGQLTPETIQSKLLPALAKAKQTTAAPAPPAAAAGSAKAP